MRALTCFSTFLIAVLLSGCSVTGPQGTTVNLHAGTVGDLRVGGRIARPAALLRGCVGTPRADLSTYICRTGPYAGLAVTMREVDSRASISDITIGPEFQGAIEEGVGIGATYEDLEDRLGHGSSCWGSPMYYFGEHTITMGLDTDGRVERITIAYGIWEC